MVLNFDQTCVNLRKRYYRGTKKAISANTHPNYPQILPFWPKFCPETGGTKLWRHCYTKNEFLICCQGSCGHLKLLRHVTQNSKLAKIDKHANKQLFHLPLVFYQLSFQFSSLSDHFPWRYLHSLFPNNWNYFSIFNSHSPLFSISISYLICILLALFDPTTRVSRYQNTQLWP
jgi:hypothetical protein